VVGAPEYCQDILNGTWLNYPRRGPVVPRIALRSGITSLRATAMPNQPAADDQGRHAIYAQLAKEVVKLVVAGHEPTASLLNGLWHFIASYPKAQKNQGAQVRQVSWAASCSRSWSVPSKIGEAKKGATA
jgi:hypothetical protein